MQQERLEIITCSYGPDLLRCRRLCESVDRHVPASVQHTLIVPARDRQAFAPLENSRRRVLVTQEVVPGTYRQLPGSERLWLDAYGWPVRGWIMQQITKLSASRATDAELLLFADSDLLFIRDLDLRSIYRAGKLRLHRIPGAMQEGEHLRWHRRSGALLGMPGDYFGSDYVGQLISWRRSRLIGLQQHLERTNGKPWHVPVAHSLKFSEYILYGSYVEHVLGEANSGHFYSSDELCHCCWFEHEADQLRRGQTQVAPGAVALLVQSNLGYAPKEEAAILNAARQIIQPTQCGA